MHTYLLYNLSGGLFNDTAINGFTSLITLLSSLDTDKFEYICFKLIFVFLTIYHLVRFLIFEIKNMGEKKRGKLL
jgi:hypothetical protein